MTRASRFQGAIAGSPSWILKFIKETRLLLTALTGLIIAITLFQTGVVGFLPSSAPIEKPAYDIQITKPEQSAIFRLPLTVRGDVRGALGENRAWLVLEPQDGDLVGRQIVISELLPDISSNTWDAIIHESYGANQFRLRIVVANAVASDVLNKMLEEGWLQIRLPEGARVFATYDLEKPE